MELRPQLLWLGMEPSAPTAAACREREIILAHHEEPPTNAEFSSARGIVFSLPNGFDATAIASAYGHALRKALWHGLRVFILMDLSDAPSIAGYLRKLRYGREPRFWERRHEVAIAEKAARWSPGPAWSGTVEVTGDEGLSEEDKLILRRAFGDCMSVRLVAEHGGRSGKVFCAYARLQDSRAGPLPLPFFAKLDRQPKIARELENYRDFTTLFVPFNQRPNLDWNRCALGAERGILVGNFIEESETLREVVERGTARAAIHSLFGGALRGWRSQAYYDASNTHTGAVALSLGQHLPSNLLRFQQAIVAKNARDARNLGATLAPNSVEELLRSLPPLTHRSATMHGDLHSENVRVHRSEAILIDFASTRYGPLVGDPAALDVSLIMGSTSLQGNEWITFARRAYQLAAVRALPPPPDPVEPGAALWSSIRLIRQIGLADQFSELEYAIAISVHLLRRACFRRDKAEETNRRALAYALAESLALDLRQVMTGKPESAIATNN